MNHAGGMEVLGGNGVGGLGLAAPSDPVELRRLNFQTPGNLPYFVFFMEKKRKSFGINQNRSC